VVVVPDRGGQREDSLHDAGDDSAGRAPSVLFEVELALEGLVDRLDDLPQRNRGAPGRSGSPLRAARQEQIR
jgi:hypothetical protein